MDKFGSWICIYQLDPRQCTSTSFISVCRSIFTVYGAPDQFSSDGGQQLNSTAFKEFLSRWGVKHRLSSVEYPHSDGRAELGIKAAKRIMYDNTPLNGSLDNDKAAKNIMQYQNTPLPDLYLSPAQILFHCNIRGYIPIRPSHYELHKEWVISAQQKEPHKLCECYSTTSHELQELPIGTSVVIQNQGGRYSRKWDRTDWLVEVLPNRQYRVRMDGSGQITLRNRRFP